MYTVYKDLMSCYGLGIDGMQCDLMGCDDVMQFVLMPWDVN